MLELSAWLKLERLLRLEKVDLDLKIGSFNCSKGEREV